MRWEYRIEKNPSYARINELGVDGWEHYLIEDQVYFFKRAYSFSVDKTDDVT